MALDRTLAVDIGVRQSGTDGNQRASVYVAGQVSALGLRVERRPLPLPQGGTSWNVVGTPSGFDETRPYLIVGAHYDSLVGPGANDNGTGVAVALEIARSVAASRASLPVEIVLFGSEERQLRFAGNPKPHHVGSRFFVAHMSTAAKRSVAAMIDLDMVGVGDSIFCVRLATGSREATDRCTRTGARIGVLAVDRVQPDFSDHGTFLKAGMNATWLYSGDQLCCNHKPTDTFEKVQRASVDRAGRLALAIVRSYSA